MITIHILIPSFTDLLKVFLHTEVTKSFLNLLGNKPPAIQCGCCTSGVWWRKNVVIPVIRGFHESSHHQKTAGFPGKLSRKEPVIHVKREGFWTELAWKLSFFPATNDGKSQVMHCDLASHLALGDRGMWIFGEGLVCFQHVYGAQQWKMMNEPA